MIKIEVGSLWADKDPREAGRTVRVLVPPRYEGDFLHCQVVTLRGGREPSYPKTTAIRAGSFRERFRQVEETG